MIYDDNDSGQPKQKIADLTGNTPSTARDYEYTCTTGCTLYSGSRYHLVFSADGQPNDSEEDNFLWTVNTSDNQVQSPASNGLGIDNKMSQKQELPIEDPPSNANDWSADSRPHSGLFKVVTEAVTLTAAQSEASSSMKLTIAKYSGNWWYKRSNDTNCVPAGTAAMATATGLAADTEYTFTAYSDANCTTAKALGTSAVTRTLMSKVTNVAVGRDDQQLLVSWDSQTGATSYDVQWKSGTQEWDSSNRQENTTSTSYTISSLSNGTEYTVRVRSKKTGNTGAWSDTQTGTPSSLTLEASNATTDSLTLTITNHSGNWYYRYTSPSNSQCSSMVSGTTTTATGLTGNTNYTFRAYSDSGCSTELATAAAILTKPAAPARPTVTAGAGSGKLTVASSLTGGSGVLTKWQYTTNNGTDWSDIDDTDNTLSTIVSTGSDGTSLSNGTTYSFKVRAVNATGAGPSSDASASASPVAEVLEASGVIDTKATLMIKNYIGGWRYKKRVPDTGVYANCSSEVAAGTTTASLFSLTKNTSYTFKAYSDSGCNTELATVNFTTKIPTLEASEVTMTTAKLTAKYFGNPSPYYYKQLQPSSDDIVCESMAIGRTAALTGLDPGTSYTYAFYGSSLDCTTEESTEATRAKFTTKSPPAPAPDPDPVLSSSSITAATATLTIANYSGSWYYKRTAPTEGDHPYGTCSAEVTGTSVALTGLRASTSYSFTAYSDSCYTTELATATVTTPAPAVTLTPSDATTTSLKLTIANHSGSWYYKYTTPDGGQCSNAVSGTTTIVSSLSSNTSYTFKAYSDSNCATELATATTVSTPAPAVILTPSDATTTSLKLTIANHLGSWYYKYTTPSGGQCSNAVSGTTTIVGSLSSDTSYTFKAYSDSGCTSVIATGASITTLASPPASPRAVNLSSSSLAVTEGSTATYTVVLDSEPTGTVTIALSSNDTTVATVSPTSLSFTTSNWEQAQTVTVAGTEDNDIEDEVTTISHEASGGGYANLTIADVNVTVEDLGAQAVQKRVNQVIEEVTPEVNRVVSANTANAVTQRVSQVVQGTLPLAGTQISWGNLPNTAQGAMELARRWAVDGETISVATLLDNSSFTTSFPSQSQATATETGDGSAPSFPWGVGAPWTTDRLPPAQSRARWSGTLRCSPPCWVLIAW